MNAPEGSICYLHGLYSCMFLISYLSIAQATAVWSSCALPRLWGHRLVNMSRRDWVGTLPGTCVHVRLICLPQPTSPVAQVIIDHLHVLLALHLLWI